MKIFLKAIVLSLLLSGCSKHVGNYNKEDSRFFTSSFETANGGRIKNHILFGESSIKLVNRARLRCKKISPESKLNKFRVIFEGNLITNHMSLFEYDCK
jgi:hypothetical protein